MRVLRLWIARATTPLPVPVSPSSKTVAPGQWEELMLALKQHRSIEYAYKRATEFAERAKTPLYAFPASPEREALLALPDYILSRDR